MTYTFPVRVKNNFKKNSQSRIASFYKAKNALAIFKTFFKKYFLRPEKQFPDALRKIERQQSHSESEVLQMQTKTIDKSQQATPQIEEELIDTLIAISVVAKRLAANLRQQNKENGGTENEQNE
ncbi:hypothetical protein [Fusicatenibacter saccharivorans]|uniref:hypothetical protein n=1 Tax=Fusicatenibacter saccharivorans TaxID=1150298 RepID=UPI003F9252ED